MIYTVEPFPIQMSIHLRPSHCHLSHNSPHPSSIPHTTPLKHTSAGASDFVQGGEGYHEAVDGMGGLWGDVGVSQVSGAGVLGA